MERELREERRVIVVLGVGRSGTSLAMQALGSLGVRVSSNLIPANVSNPKGFGEDADIVRIHAGLLNALSPSPIFPLQEGWLATPEAKKAGVQLRALVEQQLDAGTELWAFKDPRTATFLPLWTRLFNHLNIVPRFVLAFRPPEAVVNSSIKQYGNDQSYVELLFLLRNLDALFHTGGDCHLLPYEDWLSNPTVSLQGLADHVFERPVSLAGIDAPVAPELNRSSGDYIKIKSPLVSELYNSMKSCAEGQIERSQLMSLVDNQRDVLASFMPWCNFGFLQLKEKQRFQEQASQYYSQLLSGQDYESRIKRCQSAQRNWREIALAYERMNNLGM